MQIWIRRENRNLGVDYITGAVIAYAVAAFVLRFRWRLRERRAEGLSS